MLRFRRWPIVLGSLFLGFLLASVGVQHLIGQPGYGNSRGYSANLGEQFSG